MNRRGFLSTLALATVAPKDVGARLSRRWMPRKIPPGWTRLKVAQGPPGPTVIVWESNDAYGRLVRVTERIWD